MTKELADRWTSHRFAVAACIVAAVAIAASLSGLWNQFAYDDLPVIYNNELVTTLQPVSTYFTTSYWGPTGVYDALYRPLTVLGYALQWAAADGAAWVFHATNIVLYAVASVTVLAFLRQLLGAGAALVGAALFAAHPLHVEAVANVVGQAELWVAPAILGSLALYAYARRRGLLDLRTGAVIVALYGTSLLFKEHGIVLPALVVLLELVGRRLSFTRQPDDWRRMRLLVLVLGLVAAIYLFVRVQLLGALTGDEPHWGIKFLSAGERATVMLALVPEFVRLFLWPARLYSDYSPQHTPILPEFGRAHLPGLLLLLGAGAAALVTLRRSPLVAFAVSWLAVTMLAVSNLLFPIGVLLAERTLFLPSVAVALVAGVIAQAVARWPAPARTAVAALGGMLLLLGVVHSAGRTRVWEDNPTLFSTLAAEAPTNFRAPFALAEFYMLGGRPEVADTLFRRALALWPEHVPARLVYTQFLQQHDRCPEALPLFRQSMREDPSSNTALLGTVVCLLDVQRFEEARRLSVIGTASGFGSPLLRQLRQVAESVLVAMDTVDARNRWWREGRPFERTGRILEVHVGRLEPRARAEQRGMQAVPRSATLPPDVPDELVP